MEAEFINLTPVGKTLLWFRNMLRELALAYNKPMVLFINSNNARHQALNPLNLIQTRYIDLCYKWVINHLRKKHFDLQHIEMSYMVMDGIIKPLQKVKHAVFIKQLGIGACPW